MFSRVRLLYGATPLEDMINYNVIVRGLTEWTGASESNTISQSSINEGVGGYVAGCDPALVPGSVNVRQNFIQGYGFATRGSTIDYALASCGLVPNGVNTTGSTVSSTKYSTRRYQVNFALGLFTQDKLIPVKFMASQLAIEITLENPNACIIAKAGGATGTAPTYAVGNVNLIPEILEFDARYNL